MLVLERCLLDLVLVEGVGGCFVMESVIGFIWL